MKRAVSLFLVLLIVIAMPLQVTAQEKTDKIEVTQVLIDKTSLKLSVGETYKFSVYVKPGNAADKTVTLSPSKEGILSIDKFTVKAVKVGETDLTFTSSNGVKVKCEITVVAASEVSYDVAVENYPETVKRGSYAELTLKALPDTVYHASVEYKSGDSVADGLGDMTSDADGYVTWKWKVGSRASLKFKPIITVTDPDGKVVYTAEFEVTK